MTADRLTSVRELDSRQTNGVQVRLLWDGTDAGLWVAVIDLRTGESFRVRVRKGERAVDVFNHPYAYAAHHGVDTGAPRREREYVVS